MSISQAHHSRSQHVADNPQAANLMGRRNFLTKSATATGALAAIAWSGMNIFKTLTQKDEMGELVRNMPTSLDGAQLYPVEVPGSRQCVLFVLRAHEPETNVSLSEPEKASIARSDAQNSHALKDLRSNHPEYYSGIAYTEGVAVGQEDREVPKLIKRYREIRQAEAAGHSIPPEKKEEIETEFRKRFGSFAPQLMAGDIKVRGMESIELANRAADLEAQGTNQDEYYQVNHERIQFALDQIAMDWESEEKGGVRFPMMAVGNSHNAIKEIDFWNTHNTDKPPFSLAVMESQELNIIRTRQRESTEFIASNQ